MAAWIPAALSVVGTLMKSSGSEQSADAARSNAEMTAIEKDFEARQLRQQAGQAEAISQLQAAEERRRARQVQGRTLAVAAASGAGVTDPTLVNILARTAGEGAFRASTALYGGTERARLLNLQAEGADYEAEAARRGGALRASAYETQGAASLVGGAADLFGKYNAGGLFSSGPSASIGGPTSAGDIPIFS